MATGRVSLRSALMLVALTITAAAGCAGGAGGRRPGPHRASILPRCSPRPSSAHARSRWSRRWRTWRRCPHLREWTRSVQAAEGPTRRGAALLLRPGGGAQQLARKQSSGLTPDADESAPWCAERAAAAAGESQLAWRGRHTGDYDLNGEVNISDITPLGMLFGKACHSTPMACLLWRGDNEMESTGGWRWQHRDQHRRPYAGRREFRLRGCRAFACTTASTSGTGSIVWEPDFIPNPDEPAAGFSIPFAESTTSASADEYSLVFTRPPAAQRGAGSGLCPARALLTAARKAPRPSCRSARAACAAGCGSATSSPTIPSAGWMAPARPAIARRPRMDRPPGQAHPACMATA